MTTRHTILLAFAVALAGCDGTEPDPCSEDVGGFVFANPVLPALGDTVRLGEPFLFRGEINGEGDVIETGARLRWGPEPDGSVLRDSVLYEVQFGDRDGRYTIERELTISSLRGIGRVADLPPGGEFWLGVYGRARTVTCGEEGYYEAQGFFPVTVLD